MRYFFHSDLRIFEGWNLFIFEKLFEDSNNIIKIRNYLSLEFSRLENFFSKDKLKKLRLWEHFGESRKQLEFTSFATKVLYFAS